MLLHALNASKTACRLSRWKIAAENNISEMYSVLVNVAVVEMEYIYCKDIKCCILPTPHKRFVKKGEIHLLLKRISGSCVHFGPCSFCKRVNMCNIFFTLPCFQTYIQSYIMSCCITMICHVTFMTSLKALTLVHSLGSETRR